MTTVHATPDAAPDPRDVAALLDRIAEQELHERRILGAYREGYAAGVASMAGEYDRGYHDGVIAHKRAQKCLVHAGELEVARWGPGGREHFADPRPGDFPGGTVPPW